MSLDFSLHIDSCEHCGRDQQNVFDANITHNLGEMAREAGIYQCLWRPIENYKFQAKDIIEDLEKGIVRLKESPEFYKTFNSPNGWGMYHHFLPWCERVLEACKEYPEATISICK